VKTKWLFVCICSLTLPTTLPAADSDNRLRFPTAGFSIAALDSPPDQTARQALVMLLPASDNFSANVNVQIQPYTGSIEEYGTLTETQFKDAGVKVIEQKKLGKTAMVFEYSGEMRGQFVHCYARAEKAGDHVYLATATATQDQWPKQSAKLKACIDSLRCGPEEKAAAPAAPAPK
jgi:hypothetical protein